MTELYRIGVVGTKRPSRQYISGTADAIELSGRDDALHWDKTVATILTDAFNLKFKQDKRPERFQIEKA